MRPLGHFYTLVRASFFAKLQLEPIVRRPFISRGEELTFLDSLLSENKAVHLFKVPRRLQLNNVALPVSRFYALALDSVFSV